MTCYFPMIGRLGNLLFIYCFARAFCERHNFDLCLHPWIGERIFNIPEAVRPDVPHAPDKVMAEQTYQNQDSLIYTREQVRQWLQIRPELLEKLAPAKCQANVLLNVRMAPDYIGAGLVMLSRHCYFDAAAVHGYNPAHCGWEIDIAPTWLEEFDGDFNASGYNTTWAGLPSFYRLLTAPVLFRANSSFSWWAATLSGGKVYSPVIRGMTGGKPDQYCNNFVEGNWPVMADVHPNTDLHL